MRTRFFAPVATGRYTLNQEGTILEEYVDFEILEILLLRLFVRVEGVVWERPLAHGGGQGLDQSDELITSLACFAITATSFGSSLPVNAPITAPITGCNGPTVSLLSMPELVPPATARKSLRPR